MSNFGVVILAGGLGKRMNSIIPKVLHFIGDRPMLVRITEEANLLNPDKIFIVVGKYRDEIESTLQKYMDVKSIVFVTQPEPLGTGDAVRCCAPFLDVACFSKVLVLSGDVPLLRAETMQELVERQSPNLCMLASWVQDPHGYGRIVISESKSRVLAIVEDKDCSDEQKNIHLINCGVYCFDRITLLSHLPSLTSNNSQNEYYLTDLVDLIIKGGGSVDLIEIPAERQYEVLGVNTPEQLWNTELIMTKLVVERTSEHISYGVHKL
jgi:UDP-N-acetylglucosamine diphosphorylase/glucosamine-1-phosphate N-acetyltransferase